MFDQVHIVLCETTHPGNIGGAARAMKTMGLRHLNLVAPKHFPSAEATARASGADDVLAQAQVFDSLQAAVADSHLVLGCSARLRYLTMRQIDGRKAADEMLAASADGQVALVFGQEKSGLTNAQLACCHALVHIPCNPDYGSLNLAAAVQVLCYELRMAAVASGSVAVAQMEAHTAAPSAQLEGLVEHLRRALLAIGFLHPQQSRTMMLRLRHLLNRAQPSSEEIHILRGILSAAERNAE